MEAIMKKYDLELNSYEVEFDGFTYLINGKNTARLLVKCFNCGITPKEIVGIGLYNTKELKKELKNRYENSK